MKRLSLLGFVGLLSSVLAGCPIFDDRSPGDGCRGNENCSSTTTPPSGCAAPSECTTANETCGKDGQCHPGDCTSSWGCVSGYDCVVDPNTQTASCQPEDSSSTSSTSSSSSSSTGGGQSTSTSSGSGGGSTGIYCGNPKDCASGQNCAPDGTCHIGECAATGCIYGYKCAASGTCAPSNPSACGADADCASAGPGYACVSGICTQPTDQCFDQSQCAAGDRCVAGKCTPSCVSASSCAASSGYTCDTNLGICSKPTKSCSITNNCGGPSQVCVDHACVPRSAGPVCVKGDVWVENGCIPNQSASFTCSADGQQDACLAGSICLHRSCYISCDAPNTKACDSQPTLNVCKPVTSASGVHSVCSSKGNLGNQCDLTSGKACVAGKICIDGFCQ